jgi:membrane protease YdiL (CAAX protease family)
MDPDAHNPGPPDDAPPLARPAIIPLARPIDALLAGVAEAEVEAAAAQLPLALAPIEPLRAVLHLVAALVFGFTLLLVTANLLDTAGYSDEELAAVDLLLTQVISLLMILLVWILVKSGGGSAASIGLAVRSWRGEIFVGLGLTVATFAVFFLSTAVMAVIWREGLEQIQENPENIRRMVPAWSPGRLLGAMFLVALTEELLFRGVLLSHLRRIFRSWTVAVLLGSAFFAVIHLGGQQPAAVVALFPVAVLWSVTVMWRRSVVPTILAHGLFNWLMLLAMRWASEAQG